MSKLDLHQLALEIVNELGTDDPEAVAKELLRRVEAEDYSEAFEVMATVFIRILLRDLRMREMGTVGSNKVAAAREAWQQFLDSPEYSPSLNDWITLRKATREQVMEMAQFRERKAIRDLVAAKRYHYLAAEMERTGARRVGDLPADTIREAVEGFTEGKR